MATATLKTVTETRVIEEEVEVDRYVLELDKAEAYTLARILSLVGGPPASEVGPRSARYHAEAIGNALRSNHIFWQEVTDRPGFQVEREAKGGARIGTIYFKGVEPEAMAAAVAAL